MNTKIIAKLQDFIKKIKSNDEYELELRYTDNISEDTYKKVIESFKDRQLIMSETKTFDINFINKNTNYRITIDGDDIENYSKTNKITKEMIKEFIIKQPIDTPITIKTSNLKFNLKEEKPITDELTIKSLLSNLSKTLKGFRYKTRTSFISKNGLYRYDFTVVNKYNNANPKKDNSNIKFSIDNILKNDINYELEIEIINKQAIANELKIAQEFLNEGENLYELVRGIIEGISDDEESEIEEETDNEDTNDNKETDGKMRWTLPNRIGYSESIFKTFRPENYQPKTKLSCSCDGNKCDVSSDSVNLYPQQRLIKDYVQYESPYRGALLYHELGSGKSGASIAAAEGYINKKQMFVLSPASLAVNYENEILKISSIGLNLKKDWKLVNVNKGDPVVADILIKKYAINAKEAIKKTGLVWIPLYENDIPNATIIKSVVSEEDKPFVDAMTSHIIHNRYTFISYNGLNTALINAKLGKGSVNKFDNSFVIIDEVHNFASRIVNGSKLAKDVYLKLMDAKDCKIILLSGTPIINNPHEIATIINLIRGYLTIYQMPIELNEEEIINKLKPTNLLSVIDDYYIDYENKKLLLSLLPRNYKKIENQVSVVQKKIWEKDEEGFINQIMNALNLKTKVNKILLSALPSSAEEFNNYFLDMTDDEEPKIKNPDLFMRRVLGTISYYSISGSELFPKRLDDVTRYLFMSNNQFRKYADVRDIERKMDMKKGGVMDNKTSVYRAFSRMVCNFSFPETIDRRYPNDIKKALKKEIDQEEDDERQGRVTGNTPKASDIYEKELKQAIEDLKDSDYLTYQKVKTELSPKFASMFGDIETSPGTVLVYSQFRSVEGLGLFSDFLNHNGYKEIDFKKIDGNYYLTDPTIFNKMYDNKRYIIFSADKEKTRFLMNLFNGDFKNLPPKIIESLPRDLNQLYGKIAKAFFITASGAEGISLKNVRRVLITEPYWNNIRIEQVIGRAIRSCSHETLPLEDRNVTVYRYIMKFTKKQLEKNFTIQQLDKGISTDEHILMMANKKMAIVNSFLQMLKASSFDCIINAKQNKPLANGYKCYNWAIGVNNDDLSYTNDIKDDVRIMKHKANQILKKGKGKVIIKDGVKYVELNGNIYNYYSYVNAGILISEKI